MAGDWIKMRAELTTHPRFLALCRELISGDASDGFLSYVLGEDILEKGVYPPSNETVTERALRCVTDQALRDVTLSLLLRVWCAANAHGKVDGADVVMPQMGPEDVDAIAGCKGFGCAMIAVGWIQKGCRNSLVFPNFLEYNQPASLRGVPLTNAERQARHRSRIKDKPTPVTKVTKSNDREEKRREEKNKEENPPHIPPQGDEPKSTPTAKFDPAQGWPWTDPEFQAAVHAWVKHRREIGHPIKPTSHARQVKDCREWGRERALAALVESTRSGYQGLFPAKSGFGPSKPSAIEEAQKVTERMRADGVADRTISRLMADPGPSRPGGQPEIFPALGEPRRVS